MSDALAHGMDRAAQTYNVPKLQLGLFCKAYAKT